MLPPHAQARLDRFAGSAVRTSLLSVPSAVSLDAVGLEPIGEVMGATVQQVSRWGMPGSAPYTQDERRKVRMSSHQWSPYRRLVQLLDGGYTTVLGRMVDEATALGADGVIGIEMHRDQFDEALTEFSGTGTAVRSRGSIRPRHPFTTSLSGSDVAALVIGGYVPVHLHVVNEIGLRWADYESTQQQRGGRAGVNIEVDAWTRVVTRTRAAARAKLLSAVKRSGADGGLLHDLELRTREEPGYTAEVTATGTAIARFVSRATAPPSPLTIMALR